jgi:hypothetical protein
MRVKISFSSVVAAAAVSALSGAGFAASGLEVELPRQVPSARLTQQVGLTEIGLEYDCPAAQGRKVWGGVVPYDRPWTIGANPASRIKFSKDVTIGDKLVPAGTYWLLATPGKTSWTFMINKSPDALAQPRDYKPDLDVARVKVAPKSVPRRERLAFSFSDLTDERASLDLEWDTVRASLPIKVNTNQQIEAALGGLDNTWRSFANAARYMLETKKDYDAGLRYIDQSLALQSVEHIQDWYCLWIKGALYAAKGEFGRAQELAQSAYDGAHRSGGSFYLEPELAKAITDWRKRARAFEKERPAAVATSSPSKVEPKIAAQSDSDERKVKAEDTSPPPLVEGPRGQEAAAVARSPASPPVEREATSLAKTPPAGDPPLLRRARLRRR